MQSDNMIMVMLELRSYIQHAHAENVLNFIEAKYVKIDVKLHCSDIWVRLLSLNIVNLRRSRNLIPKIRVIIV